MGVKVRESQIEQALVRRVRLLGGEIRKVAWIGRRGAPDRFVMLPLRALRACGLPKSVWVELKRPGKGAEDHQTREHRRMQSCGEIVLIIDTLDEVDHWFPVAALP